MVNLSGVRGKRLDKLDFCEKLSFSAPVAPRTIRCDKSWLSDFQWLVTAFKSPGKETVNAFCQNFCIETVSGPTAAKCMMTSVSVVCES